MNINSFAEEIANLGGIAKIITQKTDRKPEYKSILSHMLNYGRLPQIQYVIDKNDIEILVEAILKLPSKDIKEVIMSALKTNYSHTYMLSTLILIRQKDNKLFKELFPQIIKTPIDLGDFILLNRSMGFGFGKSVKEVMSNWLIENISPYYAIKYRKTLAEALKISRLKSDNPIFDYLAMVFKKDIPQNKIERIYNTYPQIKAYETVKHMAQEYKDLQSIYTMSDSEKDEKRKALEKEMANLIEEYQLDTSTLISFVPQTPMILKAMMHVMTTNELLTNIFKLIDKKAIETYDDILFIQNKLTSNIGKISIEDITKILYQLKEGNNNSHKNDNDITKQTIVGLVVDILEKTLYNIFNNTVPQATEPWTLSYIGSNSNITFPLKLHINTMKHFIALCGGTIFHPIKAEDSAFDNLSSLFDTATGIQYPINKLVVLQIGWLLYADSGWVLKWQQIKRKNPEAQLHLILDISTVNNIDIPINLMKKLDIYIYNNPYKFFAHFAERKSG